MSDLPPNRSGDGKRSGRASLPGVNVESPATSPSPKKKHTNSLPSKHRVTSNPNLLQHAPIPPRKQSGARSPTSSRKNAATMSFLRSFQKCFYREKNQRKFLASYIQFGILYSVWHPIFK